MPEGTPRTWTLCPDCHFVLYGEGSPCHCSIAGKVPPLVEVIELEPVLDLLEEAVGARMTLARMQECGLLEVRSLEAEDPGVALLRAHGRLKGASDE